MRALHPPSPTGRVRGSSGGSGLARRLVFFFFLFYLGRREPVFRFHSQAAAPLPVGLNGLVRYCAGRKITDS